jgi:hypothetical protein
MRSRCWLLLLFCACIPAELIDPAEPTQTGKTDPMRERGAKSFEQRQRDCWDMPNAQACYDVGLNYELGLAVPIDRSTAIEYYVKACELSKDPEHCKAAKRTQQKNP